MLHCANCVELLSVVNFGLAIARISSGFGRHIYYLSPEQITFTTKLEYVQVLLFMLSCMFTRMCICLTLLRIFTTNLVWKTVLYIILAFIVVTGISSVIISIPQCNPIAKFWNPNINGSCWSPQVQTRLFFYHGSKAARRCTPLNTLCS